MSGRTCQTCKHFEPSAVWRRGWCRNPKLYGPQESHGVAADSLDCNRGLGCFWAPADSATLEARQSRAGSPSSPLTLFAQRPALAFGGADAGVAFATAAGGGAGSGGGRSQPPRSDGPRDDDGEERRVSFQPEERYWTDYLRIALPVLGLLILIALLWYWANALIGGGSDTEPTPTPLPIVEVEPTPPPPASPVPTATPTAPAIAPTEGVAPTATVPAVVNPTVPAVTGQTPASGTDSGGNTLPECQIPSTYEVGTTVVTTGDVNLRSEASAESESRGILPSGTQLQVTGTYSDLPDCEWWPVSDPATGQQGFVREDFLNPASEQQ